MSILEFLKNRIDNKDISFTSKKSYHQRLNILHQIIPKYWTYEYLMSNPDKLIRHIEKHYEEANKHTKYNLLSLMLLCFEDKNDLYKVWLGKLVEVKDEIENQYKSNIPTDRQKEAYMPLSEIVKVRDELPAGTTEKVLLSLYTKIPPLRSDFRLAKVYTDQISFTKHPDNENYFILPEKKLYVKDYKTAKQYKTLEIELPDDLVEDIRQLVKRQKNNEYLFIDPRTKQPYTSEKGFNKFLNSRLKKVLNNPKFHATMLRHIYISDNELHKKSVAEQENIAHQMGHSVGLQSRYSWKCWDKKKDDNSSQSSSLEEEGINDPSII